MIDPALQILALEAPYADMPPSAKSEHFYLLPTAVSVIEGDMATAGLETLRENRVG